MKVQKTLLQSIELINSQYRINSTDSNQNYPNQVTTLENYNLLSIYDSYEVSKYKANQIKKEMLSVLMYTPKAKKITHALLDIPGISLITVSYLFIYLDGYSKKYNSRKIACYCRLSPGKNRFKKSKGLPYKLNISISRAIAIYKKKDPSFQSYIRYKENEGKNNELINRNLKNKLFQKIGKVISSP